MDALTLALKEIADTKHLVEALLAASESFDRRRTQATLKELKRKLGRLERTQARLETLNRFRHPEVVLVDFRNSVVARRRRRSR